jgi:PAS domain S-box-containing protein
MIVEQKRTLAHDPVSSDADLYRDIVESATDYAIFTTSLEGFVMSWSHGAHNLLGYDADEILGRNVGIIFSFEDQLEAAHLTEMRTALADGRADDNRWHVRKDGSKLWASGLLMPLRDESARIYGFVKVMRDRTELLAQDLAVRSNEERLQLILQSATDYAIFTFDGDGTITAWNIGACRIMGYTQKQILGRDARILFIPEEREACALEWEMETASTEGRAQNERNHVRKDGSRFWGSGLTMPLKASGEKLGYLKIMRDDTERHEAEEHQQTMLREISHRVKNSLMLVSGVLAMQARASSALELKHALTDAQTRVLSIAQVHDHLWRQPDPETVDLGDFLKELCDRLAQTGAGNILAVDAEPCMIDADRAIQVALLVNELVTNAFKHAYPAEKGRIVVRVRAQDNKIKLEVSDDGVGLPDGFTIKGWAGTSLGMRVIGGLVQQLKSELIVDTNRPGAKFILQIPA